IEVTAPSLDLAGGLLDVFPRRSADRPKDDRDGCCLPETWILDRAHADKLAAGGVGHAAPFMAADRETPHAVMSAHQTGRKINLGKPCARYMRPGKPVHVCFGIDGHRQPAKYLRTS